MASSLEDTEYYPGLYTVRPIERWPGEETRERRVAQFSSPWPKTLDLLARELEFLHASNAVLQAAVTETDFRRDGTIRAAARLRHPGIIIAFRSRYGPLSYACDTYFDWRDNVRAIALSLEALRKVDRYGVSRRGEQYRGWKALPSGQMSPREATDLIASYGGEAEALRRSHPDHGGNQTDFNRVLEARKLLRGESR